MQAAVQRWCSNQAREGRVGVHRQEKKKVRTAEFSDPEKDVKTVDVTKEGKGQTICCGSP